MYTNKINKWNNENVNWFYAEKKKKNYSDLLDFGGSKGLAVGTPNVANTSRTKGCSVYLALAAHTLRAVLYPKCKTLFISLSYFQKIHMEAFSSSRDFLFKG